MVQQLSYVLESQLSGRSDDTSYSTTQSESESSASGSASAPRWSSVTGRFSHAESDDPVYLQSCNASPYVLPFSTHLPSDFSGARCLATLEGHQGAVLSLCLDGDYLYSGSEGSDIRVWRHTLSNLSHTLVGDRFRLKGDGGAVKAMVVANDRLYSAHQDCKLRAWSRQLPAPEEEGGFGEGEGGEAMQLVKHKLQATLPTVKDMVVSCLPPKNYVQIRRHHRKLWIQHADTISVLALGCGVLYSGSWDKSVKVWRLADHKCLESLTAHDDAVNAVVVDQGNAFLYTGGADAKIKVWARLLPNGSPSPMLATPTPRRKDFLPSPIPITEEGQGQENMQMQKNVLQQQQQLQPSLLRSYASAHNLLSPSLLHNQQASQTYMSSPVASMASSTTPSLRKQQGGSRRQHHHFKGSPLHPMESNRHGSHALVTTLEGHSSAINALALSPDGGLLYSASGDRSVSVWEREDSARHMSIATLLRGHQQAVLCLAVSHPDSHHSAVADYVLCSGSADGTIRVWRRQDPATVRHVCVAVLKGHRGAVKTLALSPNLHASLGIVLYSGGLDRDIRVWSLPMPRQQQQQHHNSKYYSSGNNRHLHHNRL